MKKIVKYCLTFILTALICIALLIITALIPKELVKKVIWLKVVKKCMISVIFISLIIKKNRAFLIHNYPDPITFNLTYSLDSKKSIYL